ncbi:MAG: formylglycine-generating enzyme family protein, partial [Candidatus Latescibacteria bacterium]|nr:formylglycine-generating enzyme family protein [Candidatus Latescibacterota bacterium]
ETPLLTSLKSSVSTDSTYILTWSEVSRAKSYTIEESPDSIFTDSVSKTIVGISESFTKTTDTVQTYYYRIRANNATGSSGWSNVVSITIETESKTEITMVSIPAGSFQMGSNNGESDEQPVHTVTLDSFKMSGYEITQGQYFSVIGTNPSHFTGDDTLPVENVSWIDAALFCNRLSDKEGFDSCYNETSWECDFSKNGYRLPTEAEWEYVCRAGTTSKYYSGDDEIGLNKASWYGANSDNKTHPVGRKDPNDWGLYDMHGNVWELCNDWYGEKYYSESPEKNPTGPETDTQRVMRGGSWATQLQYNSSSNRHYFPVQQTDRNEYVGFRVVRGSD